MCQSTYDTQGSKHTWSFIFKKGILSKSEDNFPCDLFLISSAWFYVFNTSLILKALVKVNNACSGVYSSTWHKGLGYQIQK